MGFLKNLEKLRAKTDSKWIVLYCNGRDCEKSYQAGTVAKEAEFKNVYVYDAGLYDWVKAHPEKSFLFDSTPVDNTKIIERSEFKSRSLPYENFITGTGVFIDIREPIQRQKIPPIKGLLHIPLDQLITRLEAKAFMDQNIYFIDAVGKQNEWLHYHLKKLGYKNFYFLDGGVAAIKN